MFEIVKPGLILFAIAAIAAFLLGAVYEITKDPIAAQQERIKNESMAKLLPEADEFIAGEINSGSDNISEVYTGYKNGLPQGYVILSETQGFSGIIGILAAFDLSGAIKDVSVIKSSETPGLGENIKTPAFIAQFINKASKLNVTRTAPNENEIQAITSATITTQAFTDAVNAALDYFNAHLKGVN